MTQFGTINSRTEIGSLDRDVTQAEVVDTTVETTVYTFTVPANTLSSNRLLHLILTGDYLNNSGSNKTLTIRVNFGGVACGRRQKDLLATLAVIVRAKNTPAWNTMTTQQKVDATLVEADVWKSIREFIDNKV